MEQKSLSHITSLRISSWISGLVVTALFLMMAKQVASQLGERTNTLLRKYCRSYKAMNGESYLNNLNIAFANLRRQLSDSHVYYAFAQVVHDDEFVYSFALCREYLSTSQCLACFHAAVNETKTCGSADGGNVIYDDCSIRYENYGKVFDSKEVILDNEAPPTKICGNESASQPITTFNKIVEELISDIRDATPKTSNFYAASTRQVSTDNATVYAVAQCVKNTSQDICQSCLSTAYDNLLNCLPNMEGQAVDFLCFMRYSLTPFFQSNQTIVTEIAHGPAIFELVGDVPNRNSLAYRSLINSRSPFWWYSVRLIKKSRTKIDGASPQLTLKSRFTVLIPRSLYPPIHDCKRLMVLRGRSILPLNNLAGNQLSLSPNLARLVTWLCF